MDGADRSEISYKYSIVLNIHSKKWCKVLKSRVRKTVTSPKSSSSCDRNLLHPPYSGVSVYDRHFVTFSSALPRVLQIVLFLWLIKCYTKCSRWWWNMPLPFQCRELFKLVCTCNQTRLIFFPLSFRKWTGKMKEDGVASFVSHL